VDRRIVDRYQHVVLDEAALRGHRFIGYRGQGELRLPGPLVLDGHDGCVFQLAFPVVGQSIGILAAEIKVVGFVLHRFLGRFGKLLEQFGGDTRKTAGRRGALGGGRFLTGHELRRQGHRFAAVGEDHPLVLDLLHLPVIRMTVVRRLERIAFLEPEIQLERTLAAFLSLGIKEPDPALRRIGGPENHHDLDQVAQRILGDLHHLIRLLRRLDAGFNAADRRIPQRGVVVDIDLVGAAVLFLVDAPFEHLEIDLGIARRELAFLLLLVDDQKEERDRQDRPDIQHPGQHFRSANVES